MIRWWLICILRGVIDKDISEILRRQNFAVVIQDLDSIYDSKAECRCGFRGLGNCFFHFWAEFAHFGQASKIFNFNKYLDNLSGNHILFTELKNLQPFSRKLNFPEPTDTTLFPGGSVSSETGVYIRDFTVYKYK